MDRTVQTATKLSPEDRLVLVCARANLGSGDRELLARLLSRGIRWDKALAKSVGHGISTLVYRHLSDRDARASLPAHVWRTLEMTYRAADLVAMRQRHEVGRLLDALREANVHVIALTGLALTETVFADPALRPMGNVDLLVRVEDSGTAAGAFQRLGYVPDEEHRPVEFYRPESVHHRPYRLPGRDVQIDAYWDLVPPRTGIMVDVNGLWARAPRSSVVGRPVRLLCPADLLLHLCLRATMQHRLKVRLRLLVDVAETCRRYAPKLDWGAVAARAIKWGADSYAYLALRLARDLLGAPVPDAILSSLGSGQPGEVTVASAKARLLTLAHADVRPGTTGGLARFPLGPGRRQ